MVFSAEPHKKGVGWKILKEKHHWSRDYIQWNYWSKIKEKQFAIAGGNQKDSELQGQERWGSNVCLFINY